MKKGANTLVWIAIALAVVVVLDLGGIQGKLSGLLGGGGITPTPAAPSEGRCYVDKTTLTLGPAKSFYNSTLLTTAGHRLVLEGEDQGMYTDGDTINVAPFDEITMYYCYNGTPAYYATRKDTFTVPCTGAVKSTTLGETSGKCYPIKAGIANTDAAIKNLTIKIYNEDNGNINAGTDNETLLAGDSVALPMEFTGDNELTYSPNGDVVIVADANQTIYKTIKLLKGKDVARPDQFTSTRGNSFTTFTTTMPSCFGLCRYQDSLLLETKSATTLDVDSTQNNMNIQLTFYDTEYYLADDGTIKLGVEDDDNNDVGETNRVGQVWVGP